MTFSQREEMHGSRSLTSKALQRNWRQRLKHGRHITLDDIAEHLTDILISEGIEVLKLRSESTRSIYLKIDYGVCNTIRISDHYSRRYRYNIGPYIHHFKVERGRYDRYYYQAKRADELARRVLKDRRTLIRRYGRKNYSRYMSMNKEKYHE